MATFEKMNIKLREHAEYSQPIMVLFGIFGLVNYPVFYLYWRFFSNAGYDDIYLRAISVLLCSGLALKDSWPLSLKPFLPFYWYLTVTYCIPFFGTYALLQSQGSSGWSLNVILGLFWLILVVDWSSFAVVLLLGICSAYAIYVVTTGLFIFAGGNVVETLIHISWVIVTSILFIRKKNNSYQETIQRMKMLAGSIAHELRTPLSAIMMSVRALGKILPPYQEAYAKAKSANLLESVVRPDQEEYLSNLTQNMQTLSQNAHTMITMLLTNLNEGSTDRKSEPCSIVNCLEEALNTYPFSLDERRLVHWAESKDSQNNNPTDFTFVGHKELVKHVLYNLIKNALYAIAAAGKGEIVISIGLDEAAINKGQLIFKDTGPGIPPENLPHIFDRFYTKTEHGTGIGLAFCQSVIKGLEGDIICTSRMGEHTTFTISFPLLREKSEA